MMLQALFQTIQSFFIDLPSIGELINNVRSGDVDLLGGFVSMVSGIFGKKED